MNLNIIIHYILRQLLTCIFLIISNILLGQWITQNNNTYPVPLKDIYFINENTGWAVGSGWNNPAPVLWTDVGGATWLETSMIEMCSSVYFTDIDNGFIGGSIENTYENAVIWRTQNGGTGVSATWDEELIDYGGTIKAISFIDSQNGWTLLLDCYWHCNYQIHNTTNGGETWEFQAGDYEATLNDIFFANANKGWAVGFDHIVQLQGVIYNTNDGGQNWESKNIDSGNGLISVYFSDSIHGWIVGSGGIILHTSNSGNEWEMQTSGTTNLLRGVHFADSLKGWVVGDTGTILHTVNGGVSWESQESGTTEDLWSVFFIDLDMGWITGDNYTILHTNNGGVGIDTHYEVQYNLRLIPNPIDKFAKILFVLPNKSNINVSFINLNGQEVASIYKGTMEKGSHEITWRSDNLPSGIYFVRLETDKGISIKKMIKK